MLADCFPSMGVLDRRRQMSRQNEADRTLFKPTTRRLIAFGLPALAVVIAAAWLFFFAKRSTQQTTSSTDIQKTVSSFSLAEIPTKSIAVLPFESLSANKDDTYFADGVQDEILNNLAKISLQSSAGRRSCSTGRTRNAIYARSLKR
jgi:hypothetical protein